jgi:histidinol-phosphatase
VITYWDVAALYPILREAGGTMSDWSGGATHAQTEAMSTNKQLLSEVLGLLA